MNTTNVIESAAAEIMRQMPSERPRILANLRAIVLSRREGAIANVSRAILVEVERLMEAETEEWEAARFRNTRVDFVEEMAREVLA
jgi:hypothetical protein